MYVYLIIRTVLSSVHNRGVPLHMIREITTITSDSCIIRTPLGPPITVLFIEVSLFSRFIVNVPICQCKGCQMGQSSGVLLKEVAAF